MNNITIEHPEEKHYQKRYYPTKNCYLFSSRCGRKKDTPISFHVPQLVKSLSLNIPEAGERHPFQAGRPCVTPLLKPGPVTW